MRQDCVSAADQQVTRLDAIGRVSLKGSGALARYTGDSRAHAKLVEQIPLAQLLAISGGADAAALRDLADRASAAMESG